MTSQGEIRRAEQTVAYLRRITVALERIADKLAPNEGEHTDREEAP